MIDRLPEVVVNADLARLADPPPSRSRRLLLGLAWLNVAAGAVALVLGTGPLAVVLAVGNVFAFMLLAWLVDGRP